MVPRVPNLSVHRLWELHFLPGPSFSQLPSSKVVMLIVGRALWVVFGAINSMALISSYMPSSQSRERETWEWGLR